MGAKKRIALFGMVAVCLSGLGVALKAHANLNQPEAFRARFHNETGTDIILVLESPLPGVGLTLNLDEGKKSDQLMLRSGSRPMMAWDDTTLELVTLEPLTVDKNMRIHVRKSVFPAHALPAGVPPIADPTDNP